MTPRGRAAAVVLVAVGAVAAGCTPPASEDWLIVDNRTDSRIVITQVQGTGEDRVVDQLSEVGPKTEGYAGGKEYCASQELQARAGSPEGRVIDVRPAADGDSCVKVWVVGD